MYNAHTIVNVNRWRNFLTYAILLYISVVIDGPTQKLSFNIVLTLKVRIGTNIVFHPGYAVSGIDPAEVISVAGPPYSTQNASTALYIAIGLSAFIVVIVALLTLRMRRKLRRQRHTPYNVTFHQEQDMAEVTERLSSVTTESQTQQNGMYQIVGNYSNLTRHANRSLQTYMDSVTSTQLDLRFYCC